MEDKLFYCYICKDNLPKDCFYFRPNGWKDSGCKSCKSKKKKERYYKDLDKTHEDSKQYRESNKDIVDRARKEYLKHHPKEELKKYAKNYYNINKARITENARRRWKERYYNDERFRTISKLRRLVQQAFDLYSKSGKIKQSRDYGIDYEAIVKHLGPCPGNRVDYHIDHIKPLVLFDLNNSEQIQEAFAPENHQWLTKEENWDKLDKYPYERISVNNEETRRSKEGAKYGF